MNQLPSRILILRELIRLGMPIAVGRMGVIAMGITDLIVVGQLAGDELADLALAYTVIGVPIHGGIALLLGVQITSARALGQADAGLARLAWRRGMLLAGLAGLLVVLLVWTGAAGFFQLVGVQRDLIVPAAQIAGVLAVSVPLHLLFIATTNYLEGQQRPLPGAVVMWLAIGVNLVLNLLLVPQFGAQGSAWATVGSRVFLAGVMVIFVLHTDGWRGARSRAALPYTTLVMIGGAAMLSALVESGAFSVMALIAGRIGGDALAAMNLATGGLLTFIGMLALGLGSAAAVLIARHGAAGGTAGRIGWLAIALSTALFAVLGALCVLFDTEVARLFTGEPGIVLLLASSLWLVALLMIPDLGQMVVDPALRAAGEHWFPTFARTAAFVGVAPAMGIWLVEYQGYGLTGILAALIAASSLAYVLLLGRWAWRVNFNAAALT